MPDTIHSPSWRRLVAYVLARDNYTCQINGPRCTTLATTGDHITPRAEGGRLLDPANVRAACRTCNSRGGATITNGRRRAFTYRIPTPPLITE
jgi:5-methylcytosine-specific restriction endonuclease McrA